MRAFVDESFRYRAPDVGTFLFAIVVLDESSELEIRRQLRAALPGRISRFHWRVDSRALRARAIRILADAPAASAVVVQHDVDRAGQERARQHAFWNLVFVARDLGADDLVIESRERSQNDRDQMTMDVISKAGIVGPNFRYAFAPARDEPLLWLADTLAGMTGTRLVDGHGQWFETDYQQCTVEVVEIPSVG